ncbi:glycerophosphodiester phosphodiesterase [Candidatus Parcubacteria bacterium]|nr:glycerophosphodiester phosphodiesterase [Candidatus Parcubacteria bacterium]
MAHKGGDCFGIENSLDVIKKSLKAGAEVIELDIRKSSDNILFCYHGNVLQFLIPQLFFKKKFENLKKKLPSISTLKENALAVGNKAILFLDVKDNSISKIDLLHTLKDIDINEVFVAHRSLNYLKKLNRLPKQWKKVINWGYNFSKSKINPLVEAGIYAIELFFWDFNKQNIDQLRSHGIDVAIPRVFISKQKYFKTCIKKGSLWITGYNLPGLIQEVRNERNPNRLVNQPCS